MMRPECCLLAHQHDPVGIGSRDWRPGPAAATAAGLTMVSGGFGGMFSDRHRVVEEDAEDEDAQLTVQRPQRTSRLPSGGRCALRVEGLMKCLSEGSSRGLENRSCIFVHCEMLNFRHVSADRTTDTVVMDGMDKLTGPPILCVRGAFLELKVREPPRSMAHSVPLVYADLPRTGIGCPMRDCSRRIQMELVSHTGQKVLVEAMRWVDRPVFLPPDYEDLPDAILSDGGRYSREVMEHVRHVVDDFVGYDVIRYLQRKDWCCTVDKFLHEAVMFPLRRISRDVSDELAQVVVVTKEAIVQNSVRAYLGDRTVLVRGRPILPNTYVYCDLGYTPGSATLQPQIPVYPFRSQSPLLKCCWWLGCAMYSFVTGSRPPALSHMDLESSRDALRLVRDVLPFFKAACALAGRAAPEGLPECQELPLVVFSPPPRPFFGHAGVRE